MHASHDCILRVSCCDQNVTVFQTLCSPRERQSSGRHVALSLLNLPTVNYKRFTACWNSKRHFIICSNYFMPQWTSHTMSLVQRPQQINKNTDFEFKSLLVYPCTIRLITCKPGKKNQTSWFLQLAVGTGYTSETFCLSSYSTQKTEHQQSAITFTTVWQIIMLQHNNRITQQQHYMQCPKSINKAAMHSLLFCKYRTVNPCINP